MALPLLRTTVRRWGASRGLLPHTRRLRAREAPPPRPPEPSRDHRHRALGRSHRAAGQGVRQGPSHPKRNEAQGRRAGPPPPPPTTRKEAYKRMRAQQASRRAETRQGAARGDDAYLPARDRGPVRKLVRDVVDSRRNIGSFFLAIAGVALIGTVYPSIAVKSYATMLMIGFFLLLIVDSVVLGRKIKRTVLERHPETTKTRGLVWYGVSRATMIRRWRFPKPDVPLGAQV
ncbi:DUF3043 domain-containing protein [Blastococcus brunescens]|uniref:DUF3043 domain-containing protein n=1 Tax=Blastococcus brunescens TaxID=1564165 RepID=A0ABZ1B5A5_9ACTN|nr:DUF3043 domain-containing protein [Blastococcus sp. BMG 8361]WRL65977.1 DUF3043 domain-containing protein [Blastococcus sp. BMG 8361]